MSNHLIQPIYMYDPWAYGEDAYEREYYCVNHGHTTPKWRTVSLLGHDGIEPTTALVGSEDDDKWAKIVDTMWLDGGVAFGTSCLKSATLRFYLPSVTEFGETPPDRPDLREGQFEMSIYVSPYDYYDNEITPVNGYILASGVKIGDPAQTVDYIVDLEALGVPCRPCGNLWLIQFGYGSPSYEMLLAENMTVEIVDVTY